MKYELQPQYLSTLRKQWALTQPELGKLIGVSASAISKYERRIRVPHPKVILALEFVFGCSARAIFPALFVMIEDELGVRTAELEFSIRHREDAASERKRQLLLKFVTRVSATPSIHESNNN
jgi:transcriptional regulator with XRE-family HTH domain